MSLDLSHPNCITLCIPPQKPLTEVVDYLRKEEKDVAKIKDEVVGIKILVELESLIQILEARERDIPENGIVLFATLRDSIVTVESEIPSRPLDKFVYTCDSELHREFIPK